MERGKTAAAPQRAEMDAVLEDLWRVIKPEIEIDPNWTDEEAKDMIGQAAGLLTAGDTIYPATMKMLKDFGTTIPNGVLEIVEEVKEEPKVASKKAAPVTKQAAKAAPAAKKEAKAEAASLKTPAKKPTSTVEKDKFGLKKGTLASKAAAMLAVGKHTMADVKKETGDTHYNLLKKLASVGFTVTKNDKGHFTITGELKAK